jgi:hypothetical protein
MLEESRNSKTEMALTVVYVNEMALTVLSGPDCLIWSWLSYICLADCLIWQVDEMLEESKNSDRAVCPR